MPKQRHQRQNFWAQIILDPYRRPLTLTFLLVSTRGLFQDMMFERLQNSTFSEDASEVIVQPLPCGTEKANSVARVVVKHTPRLCNRCASYTLVHSGGADLRILGRILDQLLAKEDLSAPLILQPAEYLRLKVWPSCCKWCFSPLHPVLLAPFSPDFPMRKSTSSRPAGKIVTSSLHFILPTVWKITTLDESNEFPPTPHYLEGIGNSQPASFVFLSMVFAGFRTIPAMDLVKIKQINLIFFVWIIYDKLWSFLPSKSSNLNVGFYLVLKQQTTNINTKSIIKLFLLKKQFWYLELLIFANHWDIFLSPLVVSKEFYLKKISLLF